MGILTGLFGMNEDDASDFGARIALASQALTAMDQGRPADIAGGLAALNAQRRKLREEAKTTKWMQEQAAQMADKNPRLASFLQSAPPDVGSSLIAKYYETMMPKEPEWKTFDNGTGDVMRYNANDPTSKPELFYDGPAPAPTGEMAQYESDMKMLEAQGKPRTSFAAWKQTTLAPAKPAEWENKYNAVVADMKAHGVKEEDIPTLSEFLDDKLKITTTADGTTTVSQGGISNARPTEGDYRAKQIVTSITGDIPEAITGFDKMTSYAGTIGGLGAGFMNDEDSQAAYDAIHNVATQAVYAVSGAGTTETEMQNKVKSMVPAVGDKPKTLRNKKRRLIDTIKSMTGRAGMTPEDMGIDPSLFVLGGDGKTTPPAPAAGGDNKNLKWDPQKGLHK